MWVDRWAMRRFMAASTPRRPPCLVVWMQDRERSRLAASRAVGAESLVGATRPPVTASGAVSAPRAGCDAGSIGLRMRMLLSLLVLLVLRLLLLAR